MSNTIDIYSTPEYRKVEAVVQLMVDGRLTSYRVATETNISKMSLATLTNFSWFFSFSAKLASSLRLDSDFT